MSRKRLSWLKKSDPYTMNQDREDPAADDYWIGGPSEFAETPHPELPDDPELGRNEVGHPNMSERNLDSKNVDEWGADDGRPYDNQPYWPDEGPTASQKDGDYWNDDRQTSRRSEARQRQSARDMYSRLKKKAFQCVKIASTLLPSATESVIEEQAFELMALPDDVVISTAIRLSDEHEDKDDDDDKKEDKKDDKKKKEADQMLQEMLQEKRLAEGDDKKKDDKDDKKKEDEDDEDKKESADVEEIDQMVNEMMGDDARMSEHGEQVQQQQPAPQQQVQQAPQTQAPRQPAPAPQPTGGTDFDIELEPTMNTVSTEDVSLEENDVLQQIWNDTIEEGARQSHQETVQSVADRQASQRRRTANNQGVQSLGGGVKQSSDSDEEFDLSKLWSHAPDVSDVMND